MLEVKEVHLSSTKVMNVYKYLYKEIYIAFCKLKMTYVHTADMTRPLVYTRDAPLAVIREQEAARTCPHCLCNPCMIQQPPSFLVRSSAPVEGNSVHSFHLLPMILVASGTDGTVEREICREVYRIAYK